MAQQTDTDDAGTLAGTEPEYQDPYADAPDLREKIAATGKYGIMHAADYEWSNARCAKEAYGNGLSRSLQFHTTWMDVDEAVECLGEIPTYGPFRPSHVAAVLVSLRGSIRVVVGREGSPVLYVWTDAPKAAYSAFTSMTAAESLVDEEEFDEWLTAENAPVYCPPITPPDEIGGFPGAEHFPREKVGESLGELEPGEKTLLRVWWDG